jgi:nucleoside-diphosphate-sugar epimerase
MPSSQSIIITGITGYLGSALAHYFLDHGFKVIGLIRPQSSFNRLEKIKPSIKFYDFENIELLDIMKDNSDICAIIHTATSYGRNNESLGEIAHINTVLPLRLLEQCGGANIPLFINTGTSLKRGLNGYSVSKANFVDWSKLLVRSNNIKFININLEHFYGPNDQPYKFTTHVFSSCLKNEKNIDLTVGTQERDFIYIDDVVDAYGLIVQKSPSMKAGFTEIDVGTGKVTVIRDLVELIHDVTKSSSKLNFGAIPIRDGEVMYSKADTKFLEDIGWSCKFSVEEGIKRMFDLER